jgi:hypothetical protein
MDAAASTVRQWFAVTVKDHPFAAAGCSGCGSDPFRNPVAHSIQGALQVMVDEILTGMNLEKIRSAVAEVIRIRVVQGVETGKVNDFITPLETMVPAEIGGRVKTLAAIAEEELGATLEKIARIRMNERRRLMAVPAALMQRGSL